MKRSRVIRKNVHLYVMSIDEALIEIQGRIKAYEHCAPKMYQGTFSKAIQSIRNGSAKQKTIETFMAKFGYSRIPEQWEKL